MDHDPYLVAWLILCAFIFAVVVGLGLWSWVTSFT